MTTESYFPNCEEKVTNLDGSFRTSNDLLPAARSEMLSLDKEGANDLVEPVKEEGASLEHSAIRRDESGSDGEISEGDCTEITERLTENYQKETLSSDDQLKADREYQMTAENSTQDQELTSPREFEQMTCTENSSADRTGSLSKQPNIPVLPKAPNKFDYTQTKIHTDRVEKFDRQWPTTIEEARRREQLRDLKTVRSSLPSISSQESIDSVNIAERKTPKDSVNIAERKTPKEEVKSVQIETVQAKRILVKSMSNSDDQKVTWPGERETPPLDNIESIPSNHSIQSIAPKKRSRFRKAMRAIGKCLSHWCYPAVDTISYGEPYTLTE